MWSEKCTAQRITTINSEYAEDEQVAEQLNTILLMASEVDEVLRGDVNYAACHRTERLTENIVMGMAILGPSPSYEYPFNQLLNDVDQIVHVVA